MDTNYYYPPLNENSFKTIVQLAEANSDYFTNPKCPYSETIKKVFTKTSTAGQVSNINLEDINEDMLITEINNLYNDLRAYGATVNASGNATDKNTYFRVSTSLLEKLVQIREKTIDIKQYAAFQQEILNIMDQVMNADQKQEIMLRLKKFTGEV